MCLDVLLQILRTFEGLAAKFASMRFERDMDSDVRGDVVAFHDLDATGAPRTLQIEVVGALATNVAFADVILVVVLADVPLVRR